MSRPVRREMRHDATTTAIAGDVMAARPRGGSLGAFFCGLAAAAALTAGIALLLLTGQGLLSTAGILVAISIGALAAGLWAGRDGDTSTRVRIITTVAVLMVAVVFTAKWSGSDTLRRASYGGSLAVLFALALPAYASGSALAALERDNRGASNIALQALAGAAVGCLLATTILIPRLDAWGVYFAAAAVLLPSAAFINVTAAARTNAKDSAMRDRVIIVTGVGSGGQLGFAIARKLADAGARLVVAGMTDQVRSLADQLGPRDRAAGVVADLTREDGAAAVIDAARQFGRLDALVNVAGGLTVIESIEDTTAEKFRREMSINADTVLLMSRAALPLLRESKGAIVNFASPAGEHAVARLGAYSAAKAAVIAITRALALEESNSGVRVNAVAPGMIDTEQNRANAAPDAKYVTRDQVADVVMFLVSDASSGVTGQTIHVPGDTFE